GAAAVRRVPIGAGAVPVARDHARAGSGEPALRAEGVYRWGGDFTRRDRCAAVPLPRSGRSPDRALRSGPGRCPVARGERPERAVPGVPGPGNARGGVTMTGFLGRPERALLGVRTLSRWLGWALLLAGCGRGGHTVQGETDATHVDIASKVSGRV